MQTTYKIAKEWNVDHTWFVQEIKGFIATGEELGDEDAAEGLIEKYGPKKEVYFEVYKEACFTILSIMEFNNEKQQQSLVYDEPVSSINKAHAKARMFL